MAEHNDLGLFGEEQSVAYLQTQGYKIRHRNWRSGRQELDIVAETDDTLVIVEVKTRRVGMLVPPSESVGTTKVRNLVYAANAYVRRFDILKPIRFDVIWVVVGGGKVEKIEHIEDAFLPSVNM